VGDQRPHHLAVDALVGGHGGRGIRVNVIGRAPLGALGERQHEHRSEMAREETQYARTDVAAARLADIVFQQRQPMLFVTALGGGQRQQDLAFLTGPALR
jgi:hypothetical protein